MVSSYKRYLIKRTLFTVLTVWLTTVLIFAVTQILPGNAANMILGTHATPEKINALERNLGLNLPLHVQYIQWLSALVGGGELVSYSYGQPVMDIVIPRFIRSLQLAIISLLAVIVLSIPLGCLASFKRDTIIDSTILNSSYIGISIPSFVIGSFLILLLGGPVFQVFPSSGYTPPSEGIVEWGSHIALPVLSLTIALNAHVMRQTRSSMIETLQTEYVRTARLKGLPESKVIIKHALRNGLLPTITILALDLGYLIGGIVVIEEIFAYPGMGRLLINSILNRDIPVVQVVVLIIAATYTLSNYGADLLYYYLDPKIKYGENSE